LTGSSVAGARPEISAVVINWNTSDLLAGCLRSLAAHGPPGRTMEVVVVDNGSADGSPEMVRRDWPAVRLIANPQNVGYTRANNQAIRESRGDFLLLINADALLTPGCLEGMLAQVGADPRAGAVGPRLVYGDGSWQRWTAGREPSLGAAVNHYLLLERLFPGRPAFRGLYLGRDVRRAFRPDWVSSACMLVRRAALDQVGLMDERFFVYMDDVDLCRRLREGGWHVWYCPEAQAVHFMGQSHQRVTGSVSPRALRSFNRYFGMRHGAPATVALKLIEGTGHGLRAAAYAGAAGVLARTGGAARLRSKARAHWTYCRAGLEPHLELS
jgi:GT2 family glycosyltransferase